MAEHHYVTHLVWQGSTGAGYRAYSRNHSATAPPAVADVALSADPHFRGDPAALNPEQLLVMAASSCQLLSFLSIAARAGVDVLSYTDDAVGQMDDAAPGPTRIDRITLRPTLRVPAGTDHDLVVRLLAQAHEECYIANSLTSQVTLTPHITHA